MSRENYLADLKEVIVAKNSDEEYINRCMTYAIRLYNSNLPVIFDRKHLALLIGIDYYELNIILNCEELHYTEINIAKKTGGIRKILSPSITLKYIQRWILDNILSKIKISEFATGFCKEKSIVTNALKHIGKECVINFDIKDFFPSINQDRVFRIFYYYGYTKDVSYTLSKLCTYAGFLPQGSPASPYISNIVCLKLDKRLSLLSNKYKCDYSRYADDITISGYYGINKLVEIIPEIIKDEGFEVNAKKTRIAFKYQRQEITGLIVNSGRITIPQKYKSKLNQEIYYCKKFGVSNHLNHIGCNKSFFKEHIYGKAYFVNMIEPELGIKILSELDKIKWDY
jgi:retron-type reverse transcriptase